MHAEFERHWSWHSLILDIQSAIRSTYLPHRVAVDHHTDTDVLFLLSLSACTCRASASAVLEERVQPLTTAQLWSLQNFTDQQRSIAIVLAATIAQVDFWRP
jgi:hypothetical protein